MTKTYIGVKMVTAWPQKHSEGPGKMEDGYAVRYANGYISWSPKDVFEDSYVEVPDEDAQEILIETRAELDRLAAGGSIRASLAAGSFGGGRDPIVEIRQAALYQAIQSASSSPVQLDTKELLDRASQIAEWMQTGVAHVPQEQSEA